MNGLIEAAQNLSVAPSPVPFDFALAGLDPTSVMGSIQANSGTLAIVSLSLFGVGMALRWVPKFFGSFRRSAR